jgi:hypothetical protein
LTVESISTAIANRRKLNKDSEKLLKDFKSIRNSCNTYIEQDLSLLLDLNKKSFIIGSLDLQDIMIANILSKMLRLSKKAISLLKDWQIVIQTKNFFIEFCSISGVADSYFLILPNYLLMEDHISETIDKYISITKVSDNQFISLLTSRGHDLLNEDLKKVIMIA